MNSSALCILCFINGSNLCSFILYSTLKTYYCVLNKRQRDTLQCIISKIWAEKWQKSALFTQSFNIVKTLSCRLKGHKLSIQHLLFIWPMRALYVWYTRGLNCADAVFLNVFANVYSGQTINRCYVFLWPFFPATTIFLILSTSSLAPALS